MKSNVTTGINETYIVPKNFKITRQNNRIISTQHQRRKNNNTIKCLIGAQKELRFSFPLKLENEADWVTANNRLLTHACCRYWERMVANC